MVVRASPGSASLQNQKDFFDRGSELAGRTGSNFEPAIQLQLPQASFTLTAGLGRLYSKPELTP
jgi:hypothetical protein